MQVERMQTAWIVFRMNAEDHLESWGARSSKRSKAMGTRKQKGGTESLCERRCRLFVPVAYDHIFDCIEDRCGGGDSCDYPEIVHLYRNQQGTVSGSTSGEANSIVFPLRCKNLEIRTPRKWFQIEGDGSIMKVSSSGTDFYPLLAVFKDGCDRSCVTYQQGFENDGLEIRGGSEVAFATQVGESYLVVVHGKYGGEFELTFETNVS